MPKRNPLLLDPLFPPLLMASATTIALRTMLMWPASGRLTDWQRREAGKMVHEKTVAVQESQAEVFAIAWAAMLTPWTIWAGGQSGQQAFDRAATRILLPFSSRASSNARRLAVRVMRPMLDVAPIAAAAPTAALETLLPASASGRVAGKPTRRRSRSR
jgi:hypothetical protein